MKTALLHSALSGPARVAVFLRGHLDMVIGIPVVAITVVTLFDGKHEHDNLALCLLDSVLYTAGLWIGNVLILMHHRRRYPELQQTLHLVWLALVFCLGYTFAYGWSYATLNDVLIWGRPFQWIPYRQGIGISLVFDILVLALYESTFFFQKWRKTVLEAERLKRENIQSQYEMLKNQVSPHFLFNSLNTLLSIIPEDSDLAMSFTQKLAEVYRYVLQNKDREVVPLRTELNFARSYLFLMETRIGNGFQAQWNIPEKYLDCLVPPLCLQMLLENAFKHNIASANRPLQLEISISTDNVLTVTNNLQPKPAKGQPSTKVGLQNIINRYQYLSDRPVEVIATACTYSVALPLLKVQTSTAADAALPVAEATCFAFCLTDKQKQLLPEQLPFTNRPISAQHP